MSIFRKLFGKSKQPTEEQGIEQHLEYLNTLRLPAIALSPAGSIALSRIGGLPSLPDKVAWPEWKGKPLAFLCQINLEEIPKDCERQGLPSSGMLYFFYDQEQSTWGFDPEDEGSWRILYAAAPSASGIPRTAPNGLEKDYIYAEKPVTFTSIMTYPDWQDKRVEDLDLSDSQNEQYDGLCSSVFKGGPAHHLFGYPSPVQGNDMDLDCQLVSHNLYCGDASEYRDPRAKELEAGRRDWILLLQLDTDDDTGMMWGDCGMLYFWIRRHDLEKGHFDKCWMILQCA